MTPDTKRSLTANSEPPKPQPRIDADTVGQFAGDAWDAHDEYGGYGDPHADDETIPEFIRKDTEGWIKLWPFRR